MGWLWEEDRDGRWSRRPLEGDAPLPLAPGHAAMLVATRPGGPRAGWALIDTPGGGSRVNARPVTGLRLLADRDEIVLADHRRFFISTETPARVEPYAGPADACCPRCQQPLLPGHPAVRCPGCGVHHHHEPDGERPRPCWQYSDGCAVCAHPTGMDGNPRWSPQEL